VNIGGSFPVFAEGFYSKQRRAESRATWISGCATAGKFWILIFQKQFPSNLKTAKL